MMKILLLAALLGGGVVVAAGAPAGRGAVVLELPPGPGNPRNSEGAFLGLADGSVLFVYSHFQGAAASDHAKARLAARTSTNGGATWSDATLLATPGEETAMNVMSASLLRLGNGDVGLFYLLRRSWHDLRMYLRRSDDEGRTWGEPVSCMPVRGYHVVNNDRVVRLASGRLLIPAAWHKPKSERDEYAALDWRGIVVCFVSDDDGRTWRASNGLATLPVSHTKSGLQEPGVVELPDGRLWGWARTDLGRQYEFFSNDGGETWTLPQPSRFTSPNSPLALKRVPGAERFMAVWNPAPAYETRKLVRPGGDRTPLVCATGAGPDGAWSAPNVLEGAGAVGDAASDDSTAGYSYTAIHFTGDAVLLAYCAGGAVDKNRLARLRVRRVPLAELQ